jgi:hypothetical protein
MFSFNPALTLNSLHRFAQPDALANANLTDYFDLAFTTLPHKVLMPDQFETAVQDLRKRFVDRSREDFVFKPSYHKRIPADGVAFYMEQIWVRSAVPEAKFARRILNSVFSLLSTGPSPEQRRPRHSDPARAPRPVPVRRDRGRRDRDVCKLDQDGPPAGRDGRGRQRPWIEYDVLARHCARAL